MIIVDSALHERERTKRPINVGLVGAGYIGRGVTLQIQEFTPGMRVAAIANRTPAHAHAAYRDAGVESVREVRTAAKLDQAVTDGVGVVTDNPETLCQAETVDVIFEATGAVEHGARTAVAALENGKHLVLMNAELDATVGPILKVRADRSGVVVTNADGDQPGVMMNLFRWVRSIGQNPVMAGNIKGFQDRYRTPETQRAFAEEYGLSPKMATSFADGTKLSMENAIVANATGFRAIERGMVGPPCDHVTEAPDLFSLEELLDGGRVDYILGAEPGPGVFVLGYSEHPVRNEYMRHLKMGAGPLYTFYVPYHLPHLEGPLTAARAVLFHDAAVTPLGPPVCDVITIAKRNLAEGDLLDGIGGFAAYGVMENSDRAREENLLPMGLSQGCRLLRPISKDDPVGIDDVVKPSGRTVDRLWEEQIAQFGAVGGRMDTT